MSDSLYLIYFFMLCGLVFCEHGRNPVIVNTPVGEIQGIRNDYSDLFLGVPYGVVDERNPFGAATPPPHFNIPYKATNDTAICPQVVNGKPTGTLHCLNLNIYVPNHGKQAGTLPVMVYLHGGGFVEGNGGMTSYPPRFLLKHNVIVVTVNYRLGPYGYLCLPLSEYSNQAMKDQLLAIRWVKDNINSFGGDTDNILLFGHSSGSASVDMLLLYANNNLFNKAILQSGVSVLPFLSEATTSLLISTIAKVTGLNITNNKIDVEEFVHKMSNVSTHNLIEITRNMVFRPCIDEVVITKTPKLNNLQNMKVLIGATLKEILYFHGKVAESFYENYNFTGELLKGFNHIPDEGVDLVKSFYLNNSKDNIVEFHSDFAFHYPIERSTKYYTQSNATVYRYIFSYDGGRNYMKIRDNITTAGATHGDELGYQYDMQTFGNVTEEDQLVIDRLSLMWTNFAKYGDPTPTETALIPVKWLPASKESKLYLDINTNLQLTKGPFQKNMAFWSLFYDKYGKNAIGINLGEKWSELDCS